MKALRALFVLTLLAALLCVAGALTAAPAAAASGSTTPPPAPTRELAIVVVEALVESRGSSTPFDYLETAFHDVAKARKWPVTLLIERLGGNTSEHPTELRLYYKGLIRESDDRLTLRTWATLRDQGKEHDFGIVTVHYYRRLGELNEETIEKIYRRLADAIAVKVEPRLFPKP